MGAMKDLKMETRQERMRGSRSSSSTVPSSSVESSTQESATSPSTYSASRSNATTATPVAQESARYKELVDKLSWAVGSTYKVSYGRRTKLYQWACRLALRIVMNGPE